MLTQGNIQGLAPREDPLDDPTGTVYGVGGYRDGMPRAFTMLDQTLAEEETPSIVLGGIPHVNGQPSMLGFGAMVLDNKEDSLYAGERDRIARLVRFPLKPKPPEKPAAQPGIPPPPPADDTPPA